MKEGKVLAVVTNLLTAQSKLGKPVNGKSQAIIPMFGKKDPHYLQKVWKTGGMWWWGWHDINKMRDLCEKAVSVPAIGMCTSLNIDVVKLPSNSL